MRPSAYKQAFAIVASLALLCGTLANTVHYLTVTHAYCAAHGVLEHAEHAMEHVVVALPAEHTSTVRRDVAPDHHDECGLHSLVPAPDEFLPISPVAVVQAACVGAPLPARLAHVQRSDVLAFAPKTSPPFA